MHIFVFLHLKPLGVQAHLLGSPCGYCPRLPTLLSGERPRKLLLHNFLAGAAGPGLCYVGGAVLARAQVPFHPAATARPPEGGREQPQGSDLVGSFSCSYLVARRGLLLLRAISQHAPWGPSRCFQQTRFQPQSCQGGLVPRKGLDWSESLGSPSPEAQGTPVRHCR